MERIVFDEELNIKETKSLDYSEEVEKTILKKATKHYSYNRLAKVIEYYDGKVVLSELDFAKVIDYTIFTVELEGKKHKLIVSPNPSKYLSKSDWEEIFQKTHKNVILYHQVKHRLCWRNNAVFSYLDPDLVELYGPYMDILESKKYINRKRLVVTYWLNKLLWVIIGVLALLPATFGSNIAIILLLISTCKVVLGTFTYFVGYDEEVHFGFSLLLHAITFPAHLISNAIENVIGDIKNDRFIEGCKGVVEKTQNLIKTVGNAIKKAFTATKDKISEIKETIKENRKEKKKAKKEINDSLSEIGKLMEENEIKPKLYKLNTENLIGTVVEFNDAYVEHSKKQIKIATKQLKDSDLSSYYSKRLDDICDHYKKNRNTESDIIKSAIISEFKNLKEDLEKYIIISNNQTEIDTYLKELKEEANQYTKARQ